ncbi:MAG: ATP-binding protein [Actinomycetia bacterium]|nr:ATP-binding protein [Actinomycetes bacterium]
MRPPDLFDREIEWGDLERFVTSSTPGTRVGILYGRRRLGKSFLLRRLAREYDGTYYMAIEQEPLPAKQRFADAVAVRLGLDAGQVQFRDWTEALRTAIGAQERRRLLILDELPYLLAHPQGAELPSVLQAIVDDSRDVRDATPHRIIVCGSALSVMSELLSGGKPLRGRAEIDLLLRPFDYRSTAAFYGIADPEVAFHLYSIVGGIPGYRDLLGDPSPQTDGDLEQLLLDTVCNPSHALFGEAAYLLREDPRVTDRALYYSVLAAIAGGATTPSKIGTVLGRDARSLAHPIDVLTTAGFVVKDDDVLLQRRPTLRVADPIVRFHELVIAPRKAAFEDRRAEAAWQNALPTIRSQIFGPAFEVLAREWTRHSASEETTGGAIGEVGSTVVNDSIGRAQHQVDVVALAEGQRRQSPRARIRVLGEAKDSDRPRRLDDLQRLDDIRRLLVTRGVDATDARLLLFGRSGFDRDLGRAAAARDDVELVDLERIRHGV